MGWDELCVLSGICPTGGPAQISFADTGTLSQELVTEIRETHPLISVNEEELKEILLEMLANDCSADGYLDAHMLATNYLFLGEWARTERTTVIGYFPPNDPDNGDPLFPHHFPSSPSYPSGYDVEICRVASHTQGDGNFTEVLEVDPHTYEEQQVPKDIVCSSLCYERRVPNIFVLGRCLEYLRFWLDWNAFPSRSVAFPNDPDPMSMEGELYEIVNSRTEPRLYGTLPGIDYGGIFNAEDHHFQDTFVRTRKGCENLARAIDEGRRGAELVPSLLEDCGWWMWSRPDMWPTRDRTKRIWSRQPHSLPSGPPAPSFKNLPSELVLSILEYLPMHSVLSLAATCSSLNRFITDQSTMQPYIRHAIRCGALYWILPVETVAGERDAAMAAFQTWLPLDVSTDAPLMHPSFPLLEFVKAVYRTDSMSNRKRLWGIVQQLGTIWCEYRSQGWQIDYFRKREEEKPIRP